MEISTQKGGLWRMSGLIAGLLLVVLGTALVWLFLGRPATGIDDAYIFFVYARNFAQGNGFVYNVGGETVEGFTSILWVLISSGLFRFFQTVEMPLLLLNLLFGTAALVVCLRRLESFGLFLLLVASSPAWFAWSHVTLMESGLWCLLLTLLVLSVVEQRSNTIAALLPFLVIVRPESMLWGVWVILVLGLDVGLKKGWKHGLKTAVFPLAVFAISLAALVSFRMAYFGFPVPNTYYAKVSVNLFSNLWNGSGYLLRYFISSPAVFLVMATLVWVLFRDLRKWKQGASRSLILVLCLLPGIGIPVLVGGDHFGAFRFYQPIWPLLCLLAAMEWPSISERLSPAVYRALLMVLLCSGWLLFPLTANLRHEFRIAREGCRYGAILAEAFQHNGDYPSVAVITAGGFKYAYPGNVFDLMGLNSTEMAHAPGSRTGEKNHSGFNRDLFYRWNPDILLCGDSAEFDSRVLNGLHQKTEFNALYVHRILQRDGGAVSAFFARSFLAGLPEAGDTTGMGDFKIDVPEPVETKL